MPIVASFPGCQGTSPSIHRADKATNSNSSNESKPPEDLQFSKNRIAHQDVSEVGQPSDATSSSQALLPEVEGTTEHVPYTSDATASLYLRQPAIWYNDSMHPVTSPMQGFQMLCLFNQCKFVPHLSIPESTSSHRLIRLDTKWVLPPQAHGLAEINVSSYKDIYVPSSLCVTILCAIGCMESTYPTIFHGDAGIFKTVALRRANRMINNTETATSNETLRILTGLLIYEVFIIWNPSSLMTDWSRYAEAMTPSRTYTFKALRR